MIRRPPSSLRNAYTRGVDIKRPVIRVIERDSKDQVGAPYIAAGTAAGNVDDRSRHDHTAGNHWSRADRARHGIAVDDVRPRDLYVDRQTRAGIEQRSEEHTSELQSL